MVAPANFARAYQRPGSAADAYALLAAGGAQLVAGGTDVVRRQDPAAHTLVDLAGAGLDAIIADAAAVRIGATATLTDVLRHPGVRGLLDGEVAAMLAQVGSPLLRNVATIGGHLARGRLSDVVPMLLVLDARVAYWDGAGRDVDLATYYAGRHHRRTHVLTEVVVPVPPPGAAGAFLKFARTRFDLALLNCACLAVCEGDDVALARVAVGETPALATRIGEVEGMLVGGPLDDAAIAAAARHAAAVVEVGTDLRAGAPYRRRLVEVAVRRCLTSVAARLGV